jgi:hypothetical protein
MSCLYDVGFCDASCISGGAEVFWNSLLMFVLYVMNNFFLWLYSPIQALAASMKLSVSLQLLDLGQSVGLLGWVISLSQGLYLYTNTEKRTHNTNTIHPCHSGIQTHCPTSAHAKTVHALDCSATVTGYYE